VPPTSMGQLVADVAAIYSGEGASGTFGSGRLIAAGLVLTARHVVDPAKRGETRPDCFHCVRLIGDQANGQWSGDPLLGRVVWRGIDPAVDLALVQLDDATRAPRLGLVFASHQATWSVDETQATGFPEAVWDEGGHVKDFTVQGVLRVATQSDSLAFAVAVADTPTSPRLWSGMSGATVGRLDALGRLHVFGAIEQVPVNFKNGMLQVASIASAFADPDFVSHLRRALPSTRAPALVPWNPTSSRALVSAGPIAGTTDGSIRSRIRRELRRGREGGSQV
jgi:hypothetical protein